jgi:hypothetical protein
MCFVNLRKAMSVSLFKHRALDKKPRLMRGFFMSFSKHRVAFLSLMDRYLCALAQIPKAE